MQATLLQMPKLDIEDIKWRRAAIRECIEFGDHGTYIEEKSDGTVVCFDCRGNL